MPSPTVTERSIPWGDAGSLATIDAMRGIIDRALRVPLVVETARSIALSCPVRDSVRVAWAIREWLASSFFFVRDPVGVELVAEPEYMLRRFQVTRKILGDCDDAAVLGCALGKAVGIPCKLVAIGFNRAGRNVAPFAHVYGVLFPTPTGAVSLDVTRPVGRVATVQRRLDFTV